jgi:hypothetical protein
MKLFNDQRNAQVFNLSVCSLLPYKLRAPTPHTGDLNHSQNFKPASEDGLKENPKHVRQK